MPKDDRLRKAEAFENYVATLYESLGYLVTRNYPIGGQQVDLVAEVSMPGVGITRLLIECKHREQARISNQVVHEFIAMFTSMRHQEGFSGGVLVTNTDFSTEARRAVKDIASVYLVTQADLEEQLFNLRFPFQEFVQTYESASIFRSYVPLRAYGSLPGEPEARYITDLEEELLHWLQAENRGFVSILADFGAGKTTLLTRLKYRMARAYLERQQNRIPVLFFLKEMHAFDGIDTYLEHTAIREFRRQVPARLVWKQVEEGRFLLLLDGFDEISTLADEKRRRRLFLELAKLFTSGSAAVLTCRPSYFVSIREYNRLMEELRADHERPELAIHENAPESSTKREARRQHLLAHLRHRFVNVEEQRRLRPIESSTIRLEGFIEAQIEEYLIRHENSLLSTLGRTAMEVKDYLYRVYDVRDLMTRPILLDMIVETLLSGNIDITDERASIGPASLYDLYTETQFQIEWHKGATRRLLTAEERRRFSEMIALKMFTEGSLEVTYREILEMVRSAPSVLPSLKHRLEQATEEQVATDIQTCTFLSRDQRDYFKFTHKSFMEFFVASYVRRLLMESERHDVLRVQLPQEILYFLGSYGTVDAPFFEVLRRGYTRSLARNLKRGAIESRNLAGAMLLAGPVVENVFLEASTLNALSFSSLKLRNVRMDGVLLEDVSIREWDLERLSWDGVIFSRVEVNALRILDRSSVQLRADDVRCHRLEMMSSSIELQCKDARIDELGITEGEATFEGDVSVSEVEVVGSRVVLKYGVGGEQAVFKRGVFKECDLEAVVCVRETSEGDAKSRREREVPQLAPWLGGCEFRKCRVFWMVAHETLFEWLRDGRFAECGGVFLVRSKAFRRRAAGERRTEIEKAERDELGGKLFDMREAVRSGEMVWHGKLGLVSEGRFLESDDLAKTIERELLRRFGHGVASISKGPRQVSGVRAAWEGLRG